MNSPYREHSIWLEMAAVVGLLALLVAPVGYLASTVAGGIGSGGGGSIGVRGASSLPTSPSPTGRKRFSSRPGGASPSFGRDRSPQVPPATRAPFSAEWRARVTADLAASSVGGEQASGSVGAMGGSNRRAGPSVAARRTFGGRGETEGDAGGQRARGAERRAKARRLASRARALAGQLQQMRRSPESHETDDSSDPSAAPTSSARGHSASTGTPGTPTDPQQVPIDDHLHWLLAAGALWGAWRLWRG